MRTAAILPVKRFAEAKRRLGASVAAPLRVELARAMVSDVLLALAQTASIERTIVVTCEDSVVASALGRRALVLRDAGEDGQSAAVGIGVERALTEGIERVLCIPGDCPALDPSELEALLADGGRDARDGDDDGVGAGDGDGAGRREDRGGRACEVVVVPDRHGTGTNGLLLTPPDAIAPSFGPGSCERHRALALAAGASFRLERPPSLLLDIDTGADLEALRARLRGPRARAPRTRAVFGQGEHTDAISVALNG
jgi:2-phospho-L-lactate/phosphoenolpyruvate guanylyltransferase